MEEDIRWQQRFSNFAKAFHKLSQAVEFIKADDSDKNEKPDNVLDELVKQGLIQSFEYTHELAWNVMKDYAVYQGNTTIGGSRDATREAFQLRLVTDGKIWMDMISSRSKSLLSYDDEIADEIFSEILNDYYPAFKEFQDLMEYKSVESLITPTS